MSSSKRFQRTLRYIRNRWPIYFGLYGLLVMAMLLIGIGLASGWYSFIPFALAIMLVATYFLVAHVYVAYLLNDAPNGTAADILIDLGQTRPHHHVVCIDLGLRETAVSIARQLTTGKVSVIDIYNPQSNLKTTLHRARDSAPKPPSDPRLNWIDGSINLLPLPDHSVHAVYVNQILSELWIAEERDQLLNEIRRILIPEGRLLLAEPIRAQTNLLLTGIVTYLLPTEKYYLRMLVKAGFVYQRDEIARGVLYCARFDKPSPAAGKQMQLKLEFI